MNRTRLLLIGILALALGFVASVYVYRNLQSKSGSGSDSGVDVIVAADDLQVGARVEERDIKIIRIPEEAFCCSRSRSYRAYLEGGVYLAEPASRRECRIRPSVANSSRHASRF